MACDTNKVKAKIRDRYWKPVYEPEVLNAACRVLRVGGVEPLFYKGIGQWGVVFCDKRGIGYKAARFPDREYDQDQFRQEAEWLRVASTDPRIRQRVVKFRRYYPLECMIERSCVPDDPGQESRRSDAKRWALYQEISDVMYEHGFGMIAFDGARVSAGCSWTQRRRAFFAVAGLWLGPCRHSRESAFLNGLRTWRGHFVWRQGKQSHRQEPSA